MSGAACAFFLALLAAGAVAQADTGVAPGPALPALGQAAVDSGGGGAAIAGVAAAGRWEWIGRPPRGAGPTRAWQERKSPRVAFVSSLVLPGLGQMYNEREFWAAAAAGVEMYFIGTWVYEQRLVNRYRSIVNAFPDDLEARVLLELHRDNRIQATWLLGITMLVSGLQAYVDASLMDFDSKPLPLQIVSTPSGGAAAALRFGF